MAQLNQLLSMFPTLEGDVVAIVLNRNKDNIEAAVETLLEMSSQAEIQPKSSSATPLNPPTATSSGHSTASSKPSLQGWANSQAFPPLPGYIPFPQGMPQPYRPPPPQLNPRAGPEPSVYYPWPHSQQPVRQYPPPPMNHVGPNRGAPVVNGGVGMGGGEKMMPGRSISAPHHLNSMPQWRSPTPGMRGGNIGHVTGNVSHVSESVGRVTSLNSTEHAQNRPPPGPVYRTQSIPRLQNRHLEPRGRFDVHGQKPQGVKGLERPKVTEQKSTSLASGEKKLIIIRGLPGSGKTTLARSLQGQFGVICSTDDFFMVDGKYVFDASLLGENHEKNRAKAHKAMSGGRSPVIIDNTNSNAWEMKPYVTMAIEFGYDVEIVEPDTPWRFKVAELAKRNKHSVSRSSIERMLERYEHRMSVERILISERPEEATPPNRTSSSESNKENRPNNKHPKDASKQTSTEKQAKVGRASSGDNHVHKTQLSRKKSLSPKPSKKLETNQQLNKQAKPVASSNQEKPFNSTDSSQTKGSGNKEEDSKVANKTSQPFSPPSLSTENVPEMGAAVNSDLSSGQISLSNVPSVGAIEADLLAQEWDSAEENELSSDEDFSQSNQPRAQLAPIGTKKRRSGDASNAVKESKSKAKDRPLVKSLESAPSPVGGQDVAVATGLALIEKSWEMAKKDSAVNIANMFPQLQMPQGPNVNSDVSRSSDTVADSNSTVAKSSDTVAKSSDTVTRSNDTVSESSDAVTRSNDTVSGSSDTVTRSGDNVKGSTDTVAGSEPVNTAQTGASDVDTKTFKKGSKRSERKLSMLTAAFDSCKGWEEKYLAEAARDEAALMLGPDSSLDAALLDSLISKYSSQATASFGNDRPPGMGVIRKSRLVSGLSLKEVPARKNVSQADSLISTLQQAFGCTDDIQPSLPGETVSIEDTNKFSVKSSTEGAVRNERTLSSELEVKDPTHLENTQGRTAAVASVAVPAVTSGAISSDTGKAKSRGVDFLCDEDPPGSTDSAEGRPHKEGGLLRRFSLSPVEEVTTSNSLDAFLSEEGSESSTSSEESDSTSQDSLERELSGAVQQVDVFPSAFPTLNKDVPIPETERSGDSPLPPPYPMGDDTYVSLGDSLYASDEEDDKGIAFYVRNEENLTKTESGGSCAKMLNETEQESVADQAKSEKELLKDGSMLSTSLPPSTDSVCTTSSDALPCTEHKDSSSEELSVFHRDLKFIIDCFPDLEPDYLKQLFINCDGNLNDTLSIALVTMITPVPLDEESEGSSTDSPIKNSSPDKAQPTLSAYEVECCNDEQIAKALQEELNEGEEFQEVGGSNESNLSSRGKETGEGEHVCEDGFVLTLSEGFVEQLQTSFWPVDQYLSYSGKVKAEDLKVQLSKKMARSIHQKWIQTLKTKYQVSGEAPGLHAKMGGGKQRVSSAPQLHSLSERHTPRKGRHPFPAKRNLSAIMDEQLAQEVGQEEMVKAVKSGFNTSQQIQLKQLYEQFPGVERSTVCNVLVGTSCNFSETAHRLKERYPSPPSSADSLLPAPSASGCENKDHPQWKAKPTYDDLRAEAALQAKLRAECFQKAAKAHSQKKMELAQYYAHSGHLHTDKMKEANTRAAKLIVQKHNRGRHLDLHGLHVEEAIAALKEKLTTTKKGGPLCVVTGRGSHSEGQVARIKPAVIKFLKSSGYKYEEVNAGMLKVQLK